MDIMAKKREAIILLSLKRQAELEAKRVQREQELAEQRQLAALKNEEQERKKLEYKQRREAILEQYRNKKKDGASGGCGAISDRSSTNSGSQSNLSSSTTNNHHHNNHNNHHPNPNSASIEPPHTSSSSSSASTRTMMMKSSQSSWSIYTGPKLFAKPTTKTNLITIQNAIVKALEGAANEKSLRRMQETISFHSETCSHFLILFRNRHQFRGLYQYEQREDRIKKLEGIGPKLVNKDDILKYYKFDTPKRLFIEVQTRDISLTIIAFAIKDHLWAKIKPAPRPHSAQMSITTNSNNNNHNYNNTSTSK